MAKALLVDTSKCIGCRACQVACKQWWDLPAVETTNSGTYENPPKLSAETWNRIKFTEVGSNGSVKWLFTREACMHCTDASCVKVCPTFARTYSEHGSIIIDHERCIGCGRCAMNCPFGIPQIGSNNITPRISVEIGDPRNVFYSCNLCRDRVGDGLTSACAKTCPTGAIYFGERDELLQQAKARIAAIQGTFPNISLYGENELGGLHSMYILTEAVSTHALPESPTVASADPYDEDKIPGWYKEAVASGTLAAFPPGAQASWYIQPAPDVPTPTAGATASPGATAGPGATAAATATPKDDDDDGGGLGWPAWTGIGIVAAAAAAGVGWVIHRRMEQSE